MNKVYEKLLKCYKDVRKKIDFKPEVALVLGSGLGDYAEKIDIVATLSYDEIEGFPVSTAEGHKGRFVFGYEDDVPMVIMQGRVHYYEGYEMSDVVLPIRLMKLLGAKVLFLTNASGGVDPTYKAGDFMLIRDHISTFIPSPLIGENIDELGTRFPDMSNVYSPKLNDVIAQAAQDLVIHLKEGVYMQATGPVYETPAESRMFRTFGADAVGMSTVCEAMAAHHAGMKVCGISCVTEAAPSVSKNITTHEEIEATANRVAPLFRQLVSVSIKAIHKSL